MKQVKDKMIALFGAVLLLIGIIFIIFPGPAILFIPLGLVLLSFEYPIAKVWLKKYQRFSSKAARKTDTLMRDSKYRFNEYRSKRKYSKIK